MTNIVILENSNDVKHIGTVHNLAIDYQNIFSSICDVSLLQSHQSIYYDTVCNT